jgi:hypothetical protein
MFDSHQKAACAATVFVFGAVVFAVFAPLPKELRIAAMIGAFLLSGVVYSYLQKKFMGIGDYPPGKVEPLKHLKLQIPSRYRKNMPETLTPEEQQLLDKYMSFYRDLETGRRQPETEEQKHFVRVILGQAAAETPHEIAYAKYMRMQR